MHYLVQQFHNLLNSSWKNRAIAAGLVLLTILIFFTFVWHVYDTVQSIRVVQSGYNLEQANTPMSINSRYQGAKPPTIFGTLDKTPIRVNTSLTLQGVIVSVDQQDSKAIIAEKNKSGEIYRVGQQISSGLKLKNVYEDKVVLDRSGVSETLYLDWGNSTPRQSVSKPAVVRKTPTKNRLSSPRRIDPEARAEFQREMKELREGGDGLPNIPGLNLEKFLEKEILGEGSLR